MVVALVLISIFSGALTALFTGLTLGPGIVSLFLGYWLGGLVGAILFILISMLRQSPRLRGTSACRISADPLRNDC